VVRAAKVVVPNGNGGISTGTDLPPINYLVGVSTMRKFSKKQYLVAGVAAAAVIGLGTGTAIAYWSSTGTGNGTATTGTSSGFVVTLSNPTGLALTPGGPSDSVAFTVNNPSSGDQNYSSAVATVTGTNKTGCDASNYTTSNLITTYSDLSGGGTANGSFSVQMIESASNQDACQGATVNLQVVAS
jgi:hypothetical protein